MKRLLTLITTLAFTLLLAACSKPAAKPLTTAELLDLGEKYLLEMNYEKAIIQFTKLIEIEPMNPRGYTGAAEAYVGLGETQKAVDILRKGLEVLPDNTTIQELLDGLVETPTNTAEPTTASAPVPESEIEVLAHRLASIFESGGYESVLDSIRSDEFTGMVTSALNESSIEPIIFNTSEDMGCGFYMVGNKIFVYIGGYADFSRNGIGVWLHANTTDRGFYVFNGSWTGDMPNGEGQVISVRDESTIEKQEGHTYSLKTTIAGMYRNGLVDGAINQQWLMDDGHTHNWNLTAANGRYNIIDSTDRSQGIIGFCTECNASLTNDEVNGVTGFTD